MFGGSSMLGLIKILRANKNIGKDVKDILILTVELLDYCI
jgi:hypothetical protein